MAVSAFGTQYGYPGQPTPWGIPQQGFPYAFQQYLQNQPLMSAPLSSTIAGPVFGVQQLLPLLHIVPQQLQHLQQLVSVQLQELQQLQQIVQLLPGQLQQIQQLMQYVPQQLQQLSQFQQPIGQSAGLGGFAATPPWGAGPQAFGAQPGHVM
jgi:TolA-binding protein